MLSRSLGRDGAETREPPPEDIAAVRGIALGVAIGTAIYVALGLLWCLA